MIEKEFRYKPLIKWTGGKFREYKFFEKFLPKNINTYYEPFFGGGGVFFHLLPEHSCINDLSSDLILFYKNINNEIFQKHCYYLNDDWDDITEFSKNFSQKYFEKFREFTQTETFDKENVKKHLKEILSYKQFNNNKLKNDLFDFILDKTSRINGIFIKEKKIFTDKENMEHIETSICHGFYYNIRESYNKMTLDKDNLYTPTYLSYWLFIREFCWGSMFRYNGEGLFNIPYGGIAYNKKCFKDKLDYIFSDEIINLFDKIKIYNEDFETFLNNFTFNEDDFIFLDPPYDSEFSEYDQNPFGKYDHKRLFNALYKLKCKWFMVIKNTDFVYDLYNKDGVEIIAFDKNYTYNARGRNNKKVEHLIIKNYKTELC
ncbi:MAG: DNA adenine methylase [Mycoplasmataceae bacterium]|jgi:DNA adenine methylase|nr:DNA adenine methylase [Mycoplasmataceae bacterium]